MNQPQLYEEPQNRIAHYLESEIIDDDEDASVKSINQQNYKEVLKIIDPQDPLKGYKAKEKKLSLIVVVA